MASQLPQWRPLKRLVHNQSQYYLKPWLILTVLLIALSYFILPNYFNSWAIKLNDGTSRYSLHSQVILPNFKYFIVDSPTEFTIRKFTGTTTLLLDSANSLEIGNENQNIQVVHNKLVDSIFDQRLMFYRTIIRKHPKTLVSWSLLLNNKRISIKQLPSRIGRTIETLTPIQMLLPSRLKQLEKQFAKEFEGQKLKIIPQISDFPQTIINQSGFLGKSLRNLVVDFYLVEEIKSTELVGFHLSL